jgi:hypothetical protein
MKYFTHSLSTSFLLVLLLLTPSFSLLPFLLISPESANQTPQKVDAMAPCRSAQHTASCASKLSDDGFNGNPSPMFH